MGHRCKEKKEDHIRRRITHTNKKEQEKGEGELEEPKGMRNWIGPVAHLEDLNQSTLVHTFIFNTTAILGG
jgi:hypothetical protein